MGSDGCGAATTPGTGRWDRTSTEETTIVTMTDPATTFAETRSTTEQARRATLTLRLSRHGVALGYLGTDAGAWALLVDQCDARPGPSSHADGPAGAVVTEG
jgi:hypothetical protein